MNARHGVDRCADFVHRSTADAGAEQRLRRFSAVLLVQRDRHFELGEPLADEDVQPPEVVALLGRSVGDQKFAQPVERIVELRQRGL